MHCLRLSEWEVFWLWIVMAVCLYMAFSLSKSFQVALTYIGYITKGDFSQPLPVQLENRRTTLVFSASALRI